MKTTAIAALVALSLSTFACTSGDTREKEAGEGTPIDSTVVGKDTTSVSTRKGIENSDEQKLTLPGRDSTLSDEPK